MPALPSSVRAVLDHLLVGGAAGVVDGEDAEAAGLGHLGRQLGRADAGHAAHHDRVPARGGASACEALWTGIGILDMPSLLSKAA